MTDAVKNWVDGYRRAWLSNDPDDIRALFTEDASYAGSPHDAEPWRGVEAIVAGWLDERDEPGTTTFEWHPVAVDGEVAVVRGVTAYSEGPKKSTYDNLWVIRLADDGRAREFTEWWIARK